MAAWKVAVIARVVRWCEVCPSALFRVVVNGRPGGPAHDRVVQVLFRVRPNYVERPAHGSAGMNTPMEWRVLVGPVQMVV